jgi:aryl-alcohol dehydrogenase-like predicted oxidoreductase
MTIKKFSNEKLGLSRLGLGCMRMSMSVKSRRKESIRTIHEALDSGINFLNTGDFYGVNGHNEKLIGEALKGRKRDDAFISLKFAKFNPVLGKMDVAPKNMKKYLTTSLQRLGLDYVDLYQPARIDQGIPIEETIGELAELVKAGYIRHIGLSEVDAETVRNAHKVHEIALVEAEYSIINNGIENDLLKTTRELGIGVIGFGVLGLGKLMSLDSKDPLIEEIGKIAAEKNISISQFAHAWQLSKGNDIIPLMGARTVEQLRDTVKSLDVVFTADEINRINQALESSNVTGSAMPKLIVRNGKMTRK